ncbi:MAG: hypothetical protein HOG73_07900 [Candidatus Marinimicrobia bacterium]|nr:hypothetical protein [Candidatus Neomarinimicrobiota bacterium]MBT5775792.1 hypothetical protein [Candidatus Neomarinimicrobiota bacterium]MBT5995628.1 hypothetical protein [Candidatus Neomarinimicrobiota bacterium]
MKKLSTLLTIAIIATIGCDKLMKDETILVDDPELQAFSEGLNTDVGLSKKSINALNDALNRHGKDGKHRRDPGFLWKVSAEMQGKLSNEEKEKLFGWMDDNNVPYLYGGGMDAKARGGPGGDRGGMDLRSVFAVLDEAQRESLKSIMDSYKSQMEEVMKKAKDGTIDREAAKAELEALEATMRAEIEALLTDEQRQKLEDMRADMKQKMEEMRQVAHDAMVSALEMTSDQESGLEIINNESGEAQKALIEKAKAEDMSREDLKDALKQLIADRNSKIEALFSERQIEIIKIYTALGMQYSKHCGDKRGDKDGKTGGSR